MNKIKRTLTQANHRNTDKTKIRPDNYDLESGYQQKPKSMCQKVTQYCNINWFQQFFKINKTDSYKQLDV